MNNRKIFVLITILFLIVFFGFLFFKTVNKTLAQEECAAKVDLLFIVDSTLTMEDEMDTLCGVITGVVDDLNAKGVDIDYEIYGLTLTRGCVENTIIVAACGTQRIVEGVEVGVGWGNGEHWGPVTAERIQNHPWRSGAVKIVMPMSDEGPYCGGEDDGSGTYGGVCDGNDTNSINNLISAANADPNNPVYAFPIQANDPTSCAVNNMNALVGGTIAVDRKFSSTVEGAPKMADYIYTAVVRAVFDADGDGYMTLTCPCDPADIPAGLIGCFDCDDADAGIIHECFYGGLVPCGRKVDDPNTAIIENAPCTLCHLFVLFKKIVDEIVVPYVFLLAVLMIVVGGIILQTAGGDPGKIGQGKKILKAAIIGVIIILVAWLIVDTIIVFLTPADSPFQAWHTINCSMP